jgi:hypothetical protein
MRVISYGGGVQSTALVVLAATGKIGHVDAALFANVGDDSEHPDTLKYVREVAIPWAAERGLEIHELTKRYRWKGPVVTLHAQLMRPESRSISIPIRMPDTGSPGKRRCTTDFKVGVVRRWLTTHGVTETYPATVIIGISLDEFQRVNNRRPSTLETPEYPLIEQRLDRERCKHVIRQAGLPVPPKSACYFCPFKRPSTWSRMKRDEPELFQKAAALESTLNARRDKLGKDHVYLTRFGKPLDEAIGTEQDDLLSDGPGGESCDEGYCWT